MSPPKKEKRAARATKSQKDYLVEYMYSNPKMNSRQFCSTFTNEVFEYKWKQLAPTLNKMGPTKTVDGWKKTWADMKVKTKQVAAEIKSSQRTTGGGDGVEKSLTPTKEKILSVMGGNIVFGDEKVSTFGVNNTVPRSISENAAADENTSRYDRERDGMYEYLMADVTIPEQVHEENIPTYADENRYYDYESDGIYEYVTADDVTPGKVRNPQKVSPVLQSNTKALKKVIQKKAKKVLPFSVQRKKKSVSATSVEEDYKCILQEMQHQTKLQTESLAQLKMLAETYLKLYEKSVTAEIDKATAMKSLVSRFSPKK